jgi:type II secretory pathway predicted ATPase ExeA
MSRARSSGSAPVVQRQEHELFADVFDWKKEYALVAAVLGPAGAGKTALLKNVAKVAPDRGFKTVFLDLMDARELFEVEDFYTWLVRKLKEDWWRGVKGSSPRLDFCNMLEQAVTKRRQPALLMLDHVEWLAEPCAHALVSDLREVQDRADSNRAWGRLRCVIAGQVSVYELRRRLSSPNLQFRLHIFPMCDRRAAEESTHDYLQHGGRSIDEAAVRYLAAQTGGEPAFLGFLDSHLNGSHVGIREAQKAVQSLLLNASHYPHFSYPAWLYILDEDFKAKADRMLDGSPVSPAGPTADIDRYQLAGAWIAGSRVRNEPCFRNGMVESILRGLRRPDQASVDPNLIEVSRLQKAARGSRDIPDLLEYVSDAWAKIGGQSGRAQVLLRTDDRKRALALDGHMVSKVELAEDTIAPGNGREIHTYAARIGGEWALDTYWPEPEEPVVVRIHPEEGFSLSVAARETLRLWSLFLEPLGGVALQLGLQTLGRHTLKTGLSSGPKKIFVSSTYKDLIEHRRAVLEQVVRRDLLFRGMEHFGADPENQPPAEKIVRQVREADVYVGIFGVRYGFVDAKSGLSMTELEFNEAETLGKPKLLYVLHEDAEVKRSYLEAEPEKQAKLQALLKRIKAKYMVYQFRTVEELAKQVYEDLGKL